MCGICGILNFDKELHVDERRLVEMRDLLVHRGPNDAGIYIDKHVGLAHRRLSIIDLKTGHQPMTNEDGTVWIVYNGEIYNYLDLKKELVAKGHMFQTNCDTEVILHAYEEFGVSCLQRFRGMFAFAIWDEKDQTLFVARDRLGKKPLYYAETKDSFIFASEIKAILLDRSIRREVNRQALYNYLSIRYVPGPLTMFENIYKLQPGHYMLLKNNKIGIHKYWDLEKIEVHPSDSYKPGEIESMFVSMLEDCVRMRLMSEVPLGVFLSGGIDSSVITALMSRTSNSQIKTFSVGYEQDFGVNEFNYAKIVADKFDTEHYEFPISSQDFYGFMPRFVWHMDEPISDPAAIPLFYLSEFAKQYVTVVLSGEGADEILAGYYIYKKMLAIDQFQMLPKIFREKIFLNLLGMFFRSEKQKSYLNLAQLPLEQRYKGVSKVFTPESIRSLYRPESDYQEALDGLYRHYYQDATRMPALDKMLYVDIKTWLPDDLLMKADKMTMAASQELRVPFLDHKLVEFAFSLPHEKKLHNGTTKHILRQVAKDLIPETIISRKKQGFPVPLGQWFRGDLYKLSREIMLDPSSACSMFFERQPMLHLFDRHRNSNEDFTEKIWNLLVFEFWHKRFMTN